MTAIGTSQSSPADAQVRRSGLNSLETGGHQMTLLQATGLGSASTVIDLVRRNQVVVLNVSSLDQRLRQRIVDMVAGGLCAMDGQVRRISADVLMACSAVTKIDEDHE